LRFTDPLGLAGQCTNADCVIYGGTLPDTSDVQISGDDRPINKTCFTLCLGSLGMANYQGDKALEEVVEDAAKSKNKKVRKLGKGASLLGSAAGKAAGIVGVALVINQCMAECRDEQCR
jgi:hypothetical protein